MAAALDMHFHCPGCGPLVYGATRALCGQTIPAPIVGHGPVRKCQACKSKIRAHKKGHRR